MTIYRNVVCFQPDLFSFDQPAIETAAKPLLRVGGFPSWPAFAAAVAVLLFALPPSGRAQSQSPAPTPGVQAQTQLQETVPVGSAVRGKELFTGQVHFVNGGPPCASCHSIAGLSFPNGGTLGPSLTHVYSKLGPEGAPVAIKTLYFPAMTAIYNPHPLTSQEQADLLAFFQEASAEPQPRSKTSIIALVGFLGFCLLLVVTRIVWRGRLRSVRQRLLERIRAQRGLEA